jgi:hypothetical protein
VCEIGWERGVACEETKKHQRCELFNDDDDDDVVVDVEMMLMMR